jgi:hypothetical protein
MTRHFQYLRIAFSIGCGSGCVLLAVLWVRSYSCLESHVFRISQNRRVAVVSFVGEAGIATQIADANLVIPDSIGNGSAYMLPMPPEKRWPPPHRPVFLRNRELYSWKVGVPYWFLITICATLAVISLPWRFSLRALLIAMTLVAVVLGLAVWAARS